jgi:hypothetical protein
MSYVNLSNYVNYDYDRKFSCEEYGCDNEGICRCMEIVDLKVLNVNINGIVSEIYNSLCPSDDITLNRFKKIDMISGAVNEEILDKYCIHRILTIHKMYNTELYNIEVENGYYGQEIGEIEFKNYDNVYSICQWMMSLGSANDKIRFVLNLEYGDVYFESTDFSLIEVNRRDITKDLNTNHISKQGLDKFKNKNNKHLAYYGENYTLPRGVVREKSDGEYSIVDGYHRIFTSPEDRFFVWKVIN